jgi:predicted metal-dependent hydrolase
MKIHSDGQLQLNAPFNSQIEMIEAFIQEKYNWILKKQRQHSSQEVLSQPCYGNDEKHLYLGIEYPLQLITARNSRINIENSFINVYHRKNLSIKNLMKNWYKQQALNYFKQRTELFANSYNFPHVRAIKVRFMKARWGSCSSNAVITYNIHLLKANPEHIDYVIIHELCHLIHANHSNNFYKLQSQLNPHWKRHKRGLNECANKLLLNF